MSKLKTKKITDSFKPEPEPDPIASKPGPKSPEDEAILKLKAAKEEKSKRGPGRPKKEAQPEPAEISIQTGIIFDAMFSIIAMRLGDHWRLTPEEKTLLNDSGNQIADKYAPNLVKVIPEIYFGSVLIFVVSQKIAAHKEILKSKMIIKVEELSKPEPTSGSAAQS